jgi:putative tricarboxylic transport membrane protein
LAIAVILFVMAGSYVSRTNLFDPQLAVVAGVFGYLMKKSHFSAPALVVGFILGPIIETNIRRALLLSDGTVNGLPGLISTVLLILSLVTLGLGIRQSRRRERAL